MAIHAHNDKVATLMMIFEARYTGGFSLMDHMGETADALSKADKSIVFIGANPALAKFKHRKHELDINVGVQKIDLSVPKHVEPTDGEKWARILGDQSELCLGVCERVLKLEKIYRVATRFQFLAPADTLEEADRMTIRALKDSPIVKTAKALNFQLLETHAGLLLEDEDGVLRRCMFNSMLTEAGDGPVPWGGFPGDPGEGGLAADVDSYFRPKEGHLEKTSAFVQNTYLRSRRLSLEFFQAMFKS